MKLFAPHTPQKILCGLTVSVMLFLSSCYHRLVLAKTDIGTSSFKFVVPPSMPAEATVMQADEPFTTERFKDAEPILPLTMPVYPANALGARAGLMNVGVKITVDADGRVTDVSPSLLSFSTPSRYSSTFQEAVRVAVMTWHFRPAQHYYFEITSTVGGERTSKFLRRENTETCFDLSFTFTASGSVLAGSSGK